MQFNFSETGSQSSLVKVVLVLAVVVVVVVVEEAVFESFLVDQSYDSQRRICPSAIA